MTTWIQVCGCFDEDSNVVPFVPDSAADYYGVYVGEGTMEWIADFKDKQSALEYAQMVSHRHGYRIDDRTFSERPENS